ncbi:hypothetical protein J7438_21935 [Thalassotalea sp. G20_0]|uniref:hypothetical protein n=1 Tax=Thalassotalea sp. G20_0 TaxID=2821093 RepID=UPI001ADAAFC0|nr:hypothetical protein [Thalassotalea sp. G20_0]MBO9496724.1 hypothetical protein [Thalassotalea sp. G20_0]
MYSTTTLSTHSTVASSGSIEDLSLSDEENVSFEKVSKFGRIIVKAPNAISQLTLEKANREIDKLPAYDFKSKGNRIREVDLVASEYSKDAQRPTKVTFDADGKLSDTEEFEKKFAPHTDSIKAMCKEALQTMGQKLNWKNISIEVRCNVLRYPFTPEQTQICNMAWHKDGCNLSMTTLLSPYYQHGNGFTGGELSFAQDSLFSPGVPVAGTIKTLEYEKPGDGFIFDGLKSLHKVENMHLLHEIKDGEEIVERLLLLCFAWPSIGDVITLSEALGKENLV